MKKKYINFKGFYLKLALFGVFCFLVAFTPKKFENPKKKKTTVFATKTIDPASYVALTVNGYNADVIANGLGALNTTTNNDVDGVNYCYLAQGTQVSGTATPTTYGLPTSGLLDVANSDLFFQMASYSSNNSLRINQNGVAGQSTVTFTELNSYEKIHLAVTSGSGASNVTFTINFSDATTQVVSIPVVPDWFNSTALPVIISGIGRGNLTNNVLENPTGNPRIYQLDLNIDPANQTKIVTGITIQKVSGGVFNLFAATGKLVSPCPAPTNITTTAINAFDASVTWNSANSTDTFEVAIVPTGNAIPALGDPSATNTYNFTPLTSNTTYDVYVRTVCATSGFSFWSGPLTFTTSCSDVTEYFENFDTYATGSTSPMPNCWNKIGNGTTYITTGSVAPMSPSNRLYMNASGTTPTETCAILPGVSNLQANTHRLKFKAYATAANRFLSIGYLTNPTDITSFIQIDEVFLPSTAASTAQEFIIVPSGIPIGITRLAIRNSGSPSGATTAYIDDVKWEAIPTVAPVCASNIIATPNATCGNFSNSISWDATSGADGYFLTIGTSTGGTDVLDNQNLGINTSYSFVGTINTTYYYTVVPFNAFGSATGCTEQNFMTVATGCYCTSVPTSNDALGITNVQLGTTDFPTTDVTYFDHSATQVTLPQGVNSNVQISFATGYTYNTYIWIDLNDNYIFDASELVYTGESLSTNPTVLNASFIMPATAAIGVHKMRIVTADALTTANPCYSGSYGVTLDFSVNIIVSSCTPASATATIVPDCANNQYSVSVNVTDLGSGSPVLSYGTTTLPITATGVITAGPFASGSSNILTVLHGSDTTCDLPLGAFTYSCPPVNDECANPTVLTPGGVFATNQVTGTNVAATSSTQTAPTCAFYQGGDVWYSAVVPASGSLTFEVNPTTGGLTDTAGSVYSGTCSSLTEIACNDSSSASGDHPLIIVTGQTPGSVLYFRVWEYGNDVFGTFLVSAYDASLSASSFDNASFVAYPNPVKDVLNLSYSSEISSVKVINLLGQEVISRKVNNTTSQIDMTSLTAGAYIVNVTVGDVVKTIKVIKQ
ncbi:GEVED domain-containing protein [uncultured Flavobacterium sp.]|uniref:GEVED domain-containing protein n=1 Tax=uncultured Flavobacterium sp. TaxID=165435 RepID=UPI0030EB9691